MNETTKPNKQKSRFRSSRIDRAQHANEMQTRVFNSQVQVIESGLKRKLKLIEREKYHVAQYLKFLRSSSGTSPFSLAPDGKADTPKIRPSTAGSRRLKFGCDGNGNHTYMTSDPACCWPSSYYMSEEQQSEGRAKSACMSRSRMATFRTTMSRIIKVEAPIRKRVSWIDRGKKKDEEEEEEEEATAGVTKETEEKNLGEVSTVHRNNSSKGSRSKVRTASVSTQYETSNQKQVEGDKEDAQSVTSRTNSIKNQYSKTKKREFMPIKSINVTFPFPVAPDGHQADRVIKRAGSANNFVSKDRRRTSNSILSSQSPRRARKSMNFITN